MNAEFEQEVERLDLTFDQAVVKAKSAATQKEKISFIAHGAMSFAEKEKKGESDSVKPKCKVFYNKLKEGADMVGLSGSWFAEVTCKVSGYDMWCMITPKISSGIMRGSDGCRYYAVFY